MKAKRRVDDETSVATYAYLGDNRRAKKVVQNCGVEETANDGGNTTVHFYYDRGWRIVETRNGSNQATAQYVWGTRYTDELVMVDVNGDATESNDCNPDDQSGESTADARYFYHQDRNWNVVALSEYDTGGSNNGRIVERYSYTPYGQFVVLTGDSGSGELGNLTPTSTVGSVFAHQGLPMDHEKTSYQNRFREYTAGVHRFAQRDPARYTDGLNPYAYVGLSPLEKADPTGSLEVEPGQDHPPDTQPVKPSRGSSLCQFSKPIDAPYYIRNNNHTCTRPCTQAHEEQHAEDRIDCCRRARYAWQKEGADKGEIVRKWNEYMRAGKAYTECRAFGQSLDCVDELFLQLCCPVVPGEEECCEEVEEYRDFALRGVDKFCNDPGANQPPRCPFRPIPGTSGP